MKRLDFRFVALGILVLASCNKGSPTSVESSTEKLTASKVSGEDKGKITAWVVLKEQANLAGVDGIKDWKARGKAVHEGLQNHADANQASLRGWLKQNGVEYKPFWIVNTIRVTTNQATLDEIAKRPDVAEIAEDKSIPVPPLLPAAPVVPIEGTEWGLNSVRAPDAWQSFGAFGDGIVVANVDTGVQYDHPALVNQYRGHQADGTFNHNYNWYDPSSACGSPSLAPCDNNNHGTHTMGTMVGDDGSPGTNRIGVAPHAKWIAAKGCEQSSCSTSSLLAAGQWIVAPTDLGGQNPRSDLRPNVVNNSWGGGGGSTFYQQIVQNWVAAGIFPAFSNGNSGSSCSSSGSPGDYPESFSAGAYDVSNVIAYFSSRGPSAFGAIIKPNIAAPGVSVRSSIPGGLYASYSGTSMASPHVAGSVALLWSSAPSLIGDIAATEALLSLTAVDTSDTTCGGTAANNNVWGEGRLDIYAAIDQAPRGPTGTLRGKVTTASGGAPLSGATITVAGTSRSASTDSTGAYQVTLPVGSFTVTASMYAYLGSTANQVAIAEGATTVQNFQLVAVPSHSLSGHVRDDQGAAVPNVKVTVVGTPLTPATTGADGSYSFPALPDGQYDVKADANRCLTGQTLHVVVSANTTLDFVVTARRDSFGYSCRAGSYAFIDANTVLALTGDDGAIAVTLPFPFTFYGQSYSTAYVSTNGLVNFLAANTAYTNSTIPSASTPNAAIYALWDDLYVDSTIGSVRTELVGTAPDRKFVIEWRSVQFLGTTAPLVRFEMVLSENGQVLLQYGTVGSDGRAQGNSATIGTENSLGTVALQYSYNEAVLSDGQAIAFVPPGITPPVNTAPVVNAGTDQIITLPAIASLIGTATDDGLPSPPATLTITWTKVSGPGTVTFGNPALPATTATFSAAGPYVLRLTASDSALSTSDDIAITVNPPGNQPPVVGAGPDQTITLPATASLTGTATDDGLPSPPATLTITWTKVSGPGTVTFGNPALPATTATFSAAGPYVLRLTASDSALSTSDDIAITVNPPVNQPPVVNAGPDQTITLPSGASLRGTATDDGLPSPPATLTTTWTKVSGPGTVTFANPALLATTATFSVDGPYTLRLTASDSALSTSDDIVITVLPPQPINQPPTVNAGPDQTILFPAIANLSGTASDDGLPSPPAILTTTWTKVSGPGTVTFGNASARVTTATFSVAGGYTLRLTASDSALSTSDNVIITVNPPVNQRPVANAGPDQTITLPAMANLSGTVTDDGLPSPPATVTTTWTKVSGPGTVTFGNASLRATTAAFSVAGSYTLRLTANDSALTGTDDIVITVQAVGTGPCTGLCTNPTTFTISGNYQSGNLGTGAVCRQTTSNMSSGNCGNFVSPRTLKVNGTTEPCTGGNWSSLPAKRNGGYCIQATAGNQSWAYFTAW